MTTWIARAPFQTPLGWASNLAGTVGHSAISSAEPSPAGTKQLSPRACPEPAEGTEVRAARENTNPPGMGAAGVARFLTLPGLANAARPRPPAVLLNIIAKTMPLTAIERDVAKSIAQNFYVTREPTSHEQLLRKFNDPRPITALKDRYRISCRTGPARN